MRHAPDRRCRARGAGDPRRVVEVLCGPWVVQRVVSYGDLTLALDIPRRCAMYAYQDGKGQARAAQPQASQAEDLGRPSCRRWKAEEGRHARQGRDPPATARAQAALSRSRDLADQSESL